MLNILVRAGCFVAVILLGYILRRINFFKKEDFAVLSKIVIRITLPAAVVTSFSGKEIDESLLSMLLFGFGLGAIYILIAFLLNRKKEKEELAFDVINMSGYNIGTFTMPFVQSFLGPTGVIATCIFDVGNAFIGLGGAHGVAGVVKEGGSFSFRKIAKNLVTSLAFDTYIIMLILNMAHITLPAPILSFAGIIGNANAFLAMLMIGVGFHLGGDFKQIGKILKILSVRYGVGIVFALISYFVLPFSREIKIVLMILAFSPIPSSASAYTEDLKEDVGLSSAVTSISIVCSICLIVGILLLTC